jgi:beta-glucanase (GH16 family)
MTDPRIGWPLCGEIDFYEYQAIWDFTPSTLHFEDRHGGNAMSFHKTLLAANEWHDISMEWTPDYIAFSQNGEEIGRYPRPENATMKNWPYNGENSFHLIINNAMAPNWSNVKPPPANFTEHILEVDYISVSQKQKEF